MSGHQTAVLLSVPTPYDASEEIIWQAFENYAWMLLEDGTFDEINFEPATELDSSEGWAYEHYTYAVDPDVLVGQDRLDCINDLLDMLLTHEMRHWVLYVVHGDGDR